MVACLRRLTPAGLLVGLLVCACGPDEGVEPSVPMADPIMARAVGDSVNDMVTVTGPELLARLDRLTAEVERLSAASASQVPADSILPGVRDAAEGLRFLGLRTVVAAFIFALTWVVVRLGVWLLEAIAERRSQHRLRVKRLVPVLRLAAWLVAVYYVISVVYQVDRSGLLAASAALGVGIGFAAQGILKNLFGGLIIIFDQPFQVGDKIRVGGTYGEVVSIGLRATRIVTPDDNLVSVPNDQVIDGQVANANSGALDCQVVVDLYLPGPVDVPRGRRIAFDAAASSPFAYLDKPIVVLVRDAYDHGFLTQLIVKAYVVDTRYEFRFASDVTMRAKAGFRAAGMLPTEVPPVRTRSE